jgi:hypothetical protein
MRKAAVLGFAALAAALAPLHATVYVPVGDAPLGPVRNATEVVVTNPDTVERQLTLTFLPTATGPSRTGSPVTVPAHGTFVLADLAPDGERGLLAIDGAAQLVVTARLVATEAGGRALSSAAVPVVSEGSLLPAGTVIHLQGLARTGNAVSRLGLITLGDAPGSCAVAAFRADGSPLGEAAEIAVPARGRSEIGDALASLGRGRVSEARLEVTCDVPAFAWAAVLTRDGSRIATVAPASALGALDADLANAIGKVHGEGDDGGHTPVKNPGNGGGGGGNAGGGGGGGGQTPAGKPKPTDDAGSFSLPGTFLDATPGDSYRAYDLALRPGVRYKRLTVEFDLFLDRWQSPLFHAVTGLRRADKTLYYGLILRADRAKTILDLGQGQLAKDGGGLWQERTQYHLRTTYDVQSRQVTLEVFHGGTRLEVLSGTMTSTDLRATNKGVRIDFGIARVADGAYFPPVGWRFSNLQVTAVPF